MFDGGFASILRESGLFWLTIPLAIWEITWKGLALWQAARRSQKPWFIAILILNTVGILPIVYLKFYKKEPQPQT